MQNKRIYHVQQATRHQLFLAIRRLCFAIPLGNVDQRPVFYGLLCLLPVSASTGEIGLMRLNLNGLVGWDVIPAITDWSVLGSHPSLHYYSIEH
jgi:hypothetical protein